MESEALVTFMFTDIEGSTSLWERHPEEMQRALERHDQILRDTIDEYGGSVFSTAGDAFAAAFHRPVDALAAAESIQGRLESEPWPAPTPIRVRVGVHSGAAAERGGDYFGATLNRAARLMSVSHGGQTLCSSTVADLVAGDGDLGLRPMGEHRLKDLLEPITIFQVGRGEFPPLRSVGEAVAGLPRQRTPLIGRAAELDQLVEATIPGALVTIVGPGGIGKTRLAIQAAAERADAFSGGAVLIDLSTAVDVGSVWSAVTQALDLSPQGAGDIGERLIAMLRSKPRVLVWDNCEQVADHVAEVLERILEGASETALVASSREPLDMEGETVIRVGPLTTVDALALLNERAATGDPATALSGPQVGQLITALDGIPLAIELAATRLRSVPLDQMAALTSDLLTVLDRPTRGRPERQRTLRTAIDWSGALLSDATRSVFAELSVLSASFDVRAVAAVCQLPPATATREMADLVDKSMVELLPDNRYRLLEPLRQYAEELLANSNPDGAIARHSQHFRNLAQEIAPRFTSADHDSATEMISLDLPNFRSVMRRCLDGGQAVEAAELCADLGWYWYYSGSFVEGITWVTSCLEATREHRAVESARARCQTALARLLFYRGDAALASEQAGVAVEMARQAGEPGELGDALIVATVAGQGLGDAAALDRAREAVDIYRTTGDRWRLAAGLFYLGVAGIFLGQSEIAPVPLEESGELFASLGDDWGLGGVTFYLGVLAQGGGEREEARRLVARAVDLLRPSGDRWRLMFALGTLAGLEDGEASEQARSEAGQIREELGLG